MAQANIQQDKVLVEGWWSKKGGKGTSLVDKNKSKHRYFVVTERYIDWYEKPGYARKGTLPLDQIFVRKHGDNVSLVIGQFGGKEFKITSEGKDPAGRVDDWFDRITNQMDVCKQRNQHGADRKMVVNPGFDDKPAQAQIVATGEMKIISQPPPQTTLQVANMPPQVVATPQPQFGQVQQMQTVQQMAPVMQMAPSPMVTVAPAPVMVAPPTTTVVTPAAFATVVPQHTTTAIGPFGQTTTYTSPAPMPSPMQTTTTYGPFGAQTTYTTAAPVMQPPPTVTRTTYGPFGTTVTQTSAPATTIVSCMACRAQFQGPVGGLVRCPYCQFVSGGSAPMQTVVTAPTATVSYGYSPAPFY